MHTELDSVYSCKHTDARRMDCFIPEKPNGRAVFFVHGGGWRGGSRQQWHPVAAYFAEQGYVCASAGYRLIPAAAFPDPVDDVRLAMAVFRSRAGELGFDPHRIAAAGSSAGGHLVGMLATINADDALGMSDEITDPDTRPDAVLAYCPAMRIYTDVNGEPVLPEQRREFFRDTVTADLIRSASPYDRITGAEPPFLFIHGNADDVISLDDSTDSAARLKASGVRADVAVLDGVGHGFGYGVMTAAQKESLVHCEAFLKDVFKR